jgi:hypothetical protein
MTTAIANPATDRQLAFLNTLRIERGYVAIHAEDWAQVDKRDASRLIDAMKALPRAATATAVRANVLDGIPFSKYAITEDGVLTFWEVKSYKGTAYLRLLVGAPGEFNRVKVGYDRATRVATVIKGDVLAAAQAFATHYVCCAVCGADLSDETSVALGLGPVCRRRFAL